jgi:hypothetical protein
MLLAGTQVRWVTTAFVGGDGSGAKQCEQADDSDDEHVKRGHGETEKQRRKRG